MPIQDVVNITVTLEGTPVTTAGFRTILVLGTNAPYGGGDLIEEYTDVDDMITDGFVSSDPEVDAVTAIFAQSPRPPSAKVGLVTITAQVNNVDIVGTDDGTYSIVINGTSFDFVAVAQTAAQIVTGLVAAVNGGSEPVTAAPGAPDSVDLTADNAGESFTISVATVTAPLANMVLTQTTANSGFGTLTALANQDNDWYGVVQAELRSEFHIEELATYAEANEKLHIAQADDAGIIDSLVTTDILSILSGQSLARTAFVVHNAGLADADQIAAAWAGKTLAVDPDVASTTWAHKTLSTVTVDTYSTTEQSTVESKGGNYYVLLAGVGATFPGRTTDGTFIDNIVASDWVKARLTETHQSRFLSKSNAGSKIPYTNAGIAIIEADAAAVIQLGIDVGHFVEQTKDESSSGNGSPFYDFPTRAGSASADILARRYRYTIEVALAGAIHTITAQVFLPLV